MMKNKILTLSIFFSVILLGSQVAFSGTTKEGHSHAVHSMAEIMVHLNHYPSDSEKEDLRKIAKDSSTTMDEHVLIDAIIGLKHKASAAVKAKLQKIMKDDSAPDALRDLAGIIYNLNHKPDAADRKKLEYLIK